MVHFSSLCFDVNGSKTNMSHWITTRVRVLDLSKVGYKNVPWILANRAAWVFYAKQIRSKN